MNASASGDQCRDVLASKGHVAPSVQQVFCAMYGHAPMTGAQLREETHLPRRTIYAALQRLKELGVLSERPSLRDTRQTYYWVPAEASASEAQATAAA